MTPGKGRLYATLISVARSNYIDPQEINPRRLRARRLGRTFKSGLRTVRFDGVTCKVTVITIREKP